MPKLLLSFLLAAATVSTAGVAGAAAAPTADPAARLYALFDREWEIHLQEDPLYASAVGRHEYDDRLPSLAPADMKRRDDLWRKMLGELAGIDRAALKPEDVVNYDMFKAILEDRLAEQELGGYQIPWNADSGFQTDFIRQPDELTFATARDYENYSQRLLAWPRYVGEQIALMREGIRRGMVLPRAVLDGYDVTISTHVVETPEKSNFYRPFESFAPGIPEAEQTRLREAGKKAVMDGAVAGYRALLEFYNQEYLPNARATLGATQLPNGPAYYRQQIKRYTTLDLSPEEIHQIGLSEVARIEAEMAVVRKQAGFTGSHAEFLHFLRTDPRFYAKTPEELIKHASWIAKRIDGKLPALFGRLPRLPYTVEPVPDAIAPKYTTGRYVDSPEGSTQPGIYWVNTYKLDARPFYNLEALTLHEAVPGHHLQGALARELTGLPNFRRFSYISAFGEGWGLYSEWLGLEAGFYKDPYSNFGRLTYEMWRACRLVIDTGLHAKGWTRQQAIDYMASHAALPLHEVETETDRYISWPGQALSYKLGELKIKELRKRAEAELGGKFDVRRFHDVVLGSGSIPLDVLEQNVVRFIAAEKTAAAK